MPSSQLRGDADDPMRFREASAFLALAILFWLTIAAQAQPVGAQDPARAPQAAPPPPPPPPTTAPDFSSLAVSLKLSPSPATDSKTPTYTVSGVTVTLPDGPPQAKRSGILALLDAEVAKSWGPVFVGLAAILLSSIFNFLQIVQSKEQLAIERQKVTDERTKAETLVAQQAATLALERTKTKALQSDLRERMQIDRSRQELADIAVKLNSFYGPFKELRAQSQLFYRYFARREKEAAQKRGEHFRTLIWLAEGNPLQQADIELLDAILGVSESLVELIEKQTGVVEPALQDLLGKYAAHIRLLRLAREQKLTALGDALSEIVYPRAIDGAIESAVRRLQDRTKELERAPAGAPELPEAAAVSRSVAYYDNNAESYTAATAALDLSELYKEFLANLPAGALILDAGCGPGRDTRAFIERGYRVVSVDASRAMVAKCRDYPHAYCVQADLRELAFKEEFDGVWACAVLLHLSEDEARQAIQRMVTALRPGGYLFISVKEGEGSSTANDGRFFQYYDEGKVRALLATDPRVGAAEKVWISRGLKETSPDETWINAISRRVI